LIVLEGIKQAIVLANENFLIAHIVPDSSIENAEMQIPFWREILASKLPSHLMPHDFNLLEKMPTTLNGKIDRKALLQYKKNKKLVYTEPRTEEEKIVAPIWEEVLNIEKIDIFSNFFEMGGHSIKAVKVMIEIEKHTGKRIPLSALFKYSTVEKFAKLLKHDLEISKDCLVPLKPNGSKTPLFIVHGAGLNILNFVNLIKLFEEDQPVYGIQGTAKAADDWYESIEDMAAHYIDAIIKINPNGPYALVGFSIGGIIAFEMARQLKEKGKKVSMIAVLDTYVHPHYTYAIFQKKLAKNYDNTLRRVKKIKKIFLYWKNSITQKEAIQQSNNNIIITEEEVLAEEEYSKSSQLIFNIIDQYQIKPQNFEIELFRSIDDENNKLVALDSGWKGIALKGLNINHLPGSHMDLIGPLNDKVIVRMIQNILDKKHAKI
ncbi:MAG: alpha/beta fold hydrolase, partial [Flavobacteriaceae bacterium]|nr:alpha/beta fold hydrolase [Flavobacteriaceae bacterium]